MKMLTYKKEKKMKKLLSALLIGMLVLAGCSSKPADNKEDNTDVERPYYVRDEDAITGTITFPK